MKNGEQKHLRIIDLLLQDVEPFVVTRQSLGTILDQQAQSPEPQLGISVFLDDVQARKVRRASVCPHSTNDGVDSFGEGVVQHGDLLLQRERERFSHLVITKHHPSKGTHFPDGREFDIAGSIENVHHQLGHSVSAHPEEDVLPIFDQVKTVPLKPSTRQG